MKTKNKSVCPNERKVKKVLADVRKKYDIQDRFLNESDFYRICEAEEIMLITPKEMETQNEDFRNAVKRLRKIKLGGFIMQLREGFNILYLRSFFSRELDMFVAAHELGHYFLKHSHGKFKNGWFVEDESNEREANLFAELASGKRREK